jgi:hypothetical protein
MCRSKHPSRLQLQPKPSQPVVVARHSQSPIDGIASMLSPDNLGTLIQDTAAYLLKQMVSGLHDPLIDLSQGDDNVITHTPPGMTYQQPEVVQRHDALLVVMDWGFAAALVVRESWSSSARARRCHTPRQGPTTWIYS